MKYLNSPQPTTSSPYKKLNPQSKLKIVGYDIQTANESAASICAVAVAIFVEGNLIETRQWLVCPPKEHDISLAEFSEIHGLTYEDVRNAPDFSTVGKQFFAYLEDNVCIARNGKEQCHRISEASCHFDGIRTPKFLTFCTEYLSPRAWPDLSNCPLETVAGHIGHPIQNHSALEVAKASGRVLVTILNERGLEWIWTQ